MTNQQSELAVAQDRSIANAIGVLEGTVRSIVSAPNQVRVEAKKTGTVTTLFLNVAPDDLRTLLDGRTARSLKTVLNALSIRSALDMQLEIGVQPNS